MRGRPTINLLKETFADRIIMRRKPVELQDLGLRAYKVQLVYELKLNDLPARGLFGEWAHNEMSTDHNIHQSFLCSDGAHFWLNGCKTWSKIRTSTENYLRSADAHDGN